MKKKEKKLVLKNFDSFFRLFNGTCFSSCGPSSIASIESELAACITCDSLISNCMSCSYGGYHTLSENFVIFDSIKYSISSSKISKDGYKNISVACTACAIGYGIDNKGFSCLSCPSNCEFCYNDDKIGFICGRCKVNYVLDYNTGECLDIENFNISESYKSSCSRIVYPNPFLREKIFGDSEYFCQMCTQENMIFDATGYCYSSLKSCLNSYLIIKNYQNDIVNFTQIMYSKPRDSEYLISFLGVSQTHSNIQEMCSICNKENFDSAWNSKEIATSGCSDLSKFKFCLNCASYQMISSNFVCQECKTCSSEIIFNDEANIDYDFFYAKKIYSLFSEAMSTNTAIHNASDTNLLKNQLQQSKILNFKGACYACPILAKNCQIPNSLLSNNLIPFYFLQIDCLDGFVYDPLLKRCIFCPNGWEFCRSYKEFEIDFLNDSNIMGHLLVKSFTDLASLIKEIEANLEFIYISNEFAIRNLTYFINFPDNFNFPDKKEEIDFTFLFSSSIIQKVPSIQNVSIVLQANTIKTDSSKKNIIYLKKRLSFSNFDSVIIRNLEFKVLEVAFNESHELSSSSVYNFDLLLDMVPGFTFSSSGLIIQNCIFINDRRMTKVLFNKVEFNKDYLISEKYSVLPLFIIYSSNSRNRKIILKDIVFSIQFNLSEIIFPMMLIDIYFFYLPSQDIFISNIENQNLLLSYVGLISFGDSNEQAKNYTIEKIYLHACDLRGLTFLNGVKSNFLTLNYFESYSSSFYNTIIAKIEDAIAPSFINNLYLRDNYFKRAWTISQLISVGLYEIHNATILENRFHNYILMRVNMKLIDDVATNQTIRISKMKFCLNLYFQSYFEDYPALFLDISSTMVNNFAKYNPLILIFENSVFEKNTINFDEIDSPPHEPRVLIMMNNLVEVNFVNLSILFNLNFEFLKISDVQSITFNILTLKFEKEITNLIQKDAGFCEISNIIKMVVFKNISISNAQIIKNLIYISNLKYSYKITSEIIILFDQFILINNTILLDSESSGAPLNIDLKNKYSFILKNGFISNVSYKGASIESASVLSIFSIIANVNIDSILIESASTNGEYNVFRIFATN